MKLLGPDQRYVTPEVVLVPVTLTVGWAQVIGPVLVALVPAGVDLLLATVVLAVAVQPLGAVTVTL